MSIFDRFMFNETRLKRHIMKTYKTKIKQINNNSDFNMFAYSIIASEYANMKKNDLAETLSAKYNISLVRYFEILDDTLRKIINKY